MRKAAAAPDLRRPRRMTLAQRSSMDWSWTEWGPNTTFYVVRHEDQSSATSGAARGE
jgi:hypothetical protein